LYVPVRTICRATHKFFPVYGPLLAVTLCQFSRNPRQKFVCSRCLFKVLCHERRVSIRGAQLYERWKEGLWSSAIGWISTHRNLLWSKSNGGERCGNVRTGFWRAWSSRTSAAPGRQCRSRTADQGVRSKTSAIFAAALTYGRRSRMSRSHAHARARDVVIRQQLLVLLRGIFGKLAGDADNIFVVPPL
jgi:hypothetical protein